ncbi:recombinase family protein [bacterium]|nr:recombinase family protein [bacterium]
MGKQKAVIYCRVSSDKQVREGHGLEGQEKSCRDFALSKGYQVIHVFRDEGVSGGITDRPGMQALLTFLENTTEEIVVVIDDIKRFARNVEGHFELKAAVYSRAARLESPSHRFEDTPEGKLVETVYAGVAEYERNSNRLQVVKRMKARMEMGYWVFEAPPGYKYIKDPVHGKIIAPDEPKATIIREALEGFAKGRFLSQIDVQNYLNAKRFCHRGKFRKVYLEQVKRILVRTLYAGVIERPEWGIERIQAKHQALITWAMFLKIQKKLKEQAKNPFRKDLDEDFPLRGFALCRCCQKPLTASWSKGRNRKYAFYRCNNKIGECPEANKSHRKEVIETVFEQGLKKVIPSPQILALTKEITSEIYSNRLESMTQYSCEMEKKVAIKQNEIESIIDRITKTESPTVQKALEAKVDQLETERKEALVELEKLQTRRADFGTALDRVLEFMKNPHQIWVSGDFSQKQRVQRMVFARPIVIDPETGVGTAGLSLPFRVCAESDGQRFKIGRRELNI